MFLTGGNALQTHESAAMNGGCGLVLVPEIKSGKAQYMDVDGSYAPLLSFYDRQIPAKSFRKAEDISKIRNCRIHILAAGVKEDWAAFVEKSGRTRDLWRVSFP